MCAGDLVGGEIPQIFPGEDPNSREGSTGLRFPLCRDCPQGGRLLWEKSEPGGESVHGGGGRGSAAPPAGRGMRRPPSSSHHRRGLTFSPRGRPSGGRSKTADEEVSPGVGCRRNQAAGGGETRQWAGRRLLSFLSAHRECLSLDLQPGWPGSLCLQVNRLGSELSQVGAEGHHKARPAHMPAAWRGPRLPNPGDAASLGDRGAQRWPLDISSSWGSEAGLGVRQMETRTAERWGGWRHTWPRRKDRSRVPAPSLSASHTRPERLA